MAVKLAGTYSTEYNCDVDQSNANPDYLRKLNYQFRNDVELDQLKLQYREKFINIV